MYVTGATLETIDDVKFHHSYTYDEERDVRLIKQYNAVVKVTREMYWMNTDRIASELEQSWIGSKLHEVLNKLEKWLGKYKNK
ncbi:hypothetical protein CIL05_07525 [Virgibacillus profundi]|uniref:Uncharacterized protein n=1 Tax=Virgibacillus profundi TaxID=2024555 RepID=A0A2A2IE74_9BACI|nr:hypothetical protein [Virgibacillus profundi]PAV30311.1 hypothetical protein CIL05_07525 [Virgibacillus profundi]PXY54483.1 hypothetical protein CIT14_07610 [Virgibacillus profundi]